MKLPELDLRPVIVAIAGPNGAGKTTFFYSHIASAGLRFIEADSLANELGIDAYSAAKIADRLRAQLVSMKESFAFETILSDPAGDKIDFLKRAVELGYTVVMCFIGLDDYKLSEMRVTMRVSQGGHDVPTEKLRSRFPRTMKNLNAAITMLPIVYVFDNSDMNRSFRRIATFKNGEQISSSPSPPNWFKALLSQT